jgi:subtilisin family serine protease
MLIAQVQSVSELDSQYLNWYNADPSNGEIMGTGVDKAYAEFIKDKAPKKTVVVAVLDSGVDIYHKELEERIWVNADEIAGNGLDDDMNGYIDDIHGWNFLGNSDGENVLQENLEYTRILRDYGKDHPDYQRAKSTFDTEFSLRNEDQIQLGKFKNIYDQCTRILREETGVDIHNVEDLVKANPKSERGLNAKGFLQERYGMGLTESGLNAMLEQNAQFMDYYLNLEYNARDLVQDDPLDLSDRAYGNPDVKGLRPDHGTSVAGVIAADRMNEEGIMGVAQHVKIMALRTTPDGDERDKDVALGIIYAVDNGADIINMSFGKAFSPQREFVEEAIRYAEEHGVLMVHSSGNSGENIDIEKSYPKGVYLDGTEASNWLCVGASSQTLDTEIAAVFSNYGSTQVDLFAPGVNIISTDTTDTYSMHDGTSVSAPVVSGIAALVLAYYPELTPEELIDILMTSSYKFKKPKKVLTPSLTAEKRKKAKFSSLSKNGGIVNAYNALVEAERRAAASK